VDRERPDETEGKCDQVDAQGALAVDGDQQRNQGHPSEERDVEVRHGRAQQQAGEHRQAEAKPHGKSSLRQRVLLARSAERLHRSHLLAVRLGVGVARRLACTRDRHVECVGGQRPGDHGGLDADDVTGELESTADWWKVQRRRDGNSGTCKSGKTNRNFK